MRKLSPTEERALVILAKHGTICPGTNGSPDGLHEVRRILDGLVKAKRVVVEGSDDGPAYRLSARGQWDADAIASEGAET